MHDPMSPKEVSKIINEEFDVIRKLFLEKNDAYASEINALDNFDEQSHNTKLSVFEVWSVLANKHDIAIRNAIRKAPEKPEEGSEGMISRVRDRIVYSLLLLALLKRLEAEQKKP